MAWCLVHGTFLICNFSAFLRNERKLTFHKGKTMSPRCIIFHPSLTISSGETTPNFIVEPSQPGKAMN